MSFISKMYTQCKLYLCSQDVLIFSLFFSLAIISVAYVGKQHQK